MVELIAVLSSITLRSRGARKAEEERAPVFRALTHVPEAQRLESREVIALAERREVEALLVGEETALELELSDEVERPRLAQALQVRAGEPLPHERERADGVGLEERLSVLLEGGHGHADLGDQARAHELALREGSERTCPALPRLIERAEPLQVRLFAEREVYELAERIALLEEPVGEHQSRRGIVGVVRDGRSQRRFVLIVSLRGTGLQLEDQPIIRLRLSPLLRDGLVATARLPRRELRPRELDARAAPVIARTDGDAPLAFHSQKVNPRVAAPDDLEAMRDDLFFGVSRPLDE